MPVNWKFSPALTCVVALALVVCALTAHADAAAPSPTTQFASDKHGYQLSYPSQWRRINPQKIGNAELSLTPDADNVQTRFAIMYFEDNGDGKQETDAQIEQFLLTPLKRIGEASLDSAVDSKLDQQPARKLRISVKPAADSTAKPMVQDVVYCIHNKALYFVMIAGPSEKMSEYEPGFGQIVDTFHFTK